MSSQPIVQNKKFQKPGYVLKWIIIAIPVILEINLNIGFYRKEHHPTYENLVGIHEIDTSTALHPGISTEVLNPQLWKKFTIERDDRLYVLFPNDSISTNFFEADTLNKIIKLTSGDSLSIGQLHYSKIDSTHWLFEGTFGKDSLHFVTNQIDVSKHMLLRDYGKVIWSWSTSSPQMFYEH